MNFEKNFHVVAFSEEEDFEFINNVSDDIKVDDVSFGEKEVTFREKVPGTENTFVDENDDSSYSEESDVEKEYVPEKETDWESDRDVSKFMLYISSMYPARIPKHDGTSPAACEVAIKFLKKLLSEISIAIRKDDPVSPILPISELENSFKYKIMSDIIILKDYKKKLEKKISDNLNKKHQKTASVNEDNSDIDFIEDVYNNILEKEAMLKNAFTPKLQVVVTPFERAISGIIINSVVAGGKPLEDVFEFLKKKYDLNEREELAIMQIIMDSGFPIYRDRGTISSNPDDASEEESYGVEFIKGYFA
jgi:hypothetical protein